MGVTSKIGPKDNCSNIMLSLQSSRYQAVSLCWPSRQHCLSLILIFCGCLKHQIVKSRKWLEREHFAFSRLIQKLLYTSVMLIVVPSSCRINERETARHLPVNPCQEQYLLITISIRSWRYCAFGDTVC